MRYQLRHEPLAESQGIEPYPLRSALAFEASWTTHVRDPPLVLLARTISRVLSKDHHLSVPPTRALGIPTPGIALCLTLLLASSYFLGWT